MRDKFTNCHFSGSRFAVVGDGVPLADANPRGPASLGDRLDAEAKALLIWSDNNTQGSLRDRENFIDGWGMTHGG